MTAPGASLLTGLFLAVCALANANEGGEAVSPIAAPLKWEAESDQTDSARSKVAGWPHHRLSLQGGITLHHKDDGRRSKETDLGQGWLTLGMRLSKYVEAFGEIFVLRYSEKGEEDEATYPGFKDSMDTMYSLPLPMLLAPVGVNFYPISFPGFDGFVGTGLSLATVGEADRSSGGGLGPLTVHTGVRIRPGVPMELLAQLKYLHIADTRFCEDDYCPWEHYVRRVVFLYGAGVCW